MALRCFIAIVIPEEVKKKLGEIIEYLKTSGADVKWVRPENIHITLKFLGNTDEAIISRITDSINKKMSFYSPFYIKISGMGVFPPGKRPKVFWIGIQESKSLMDLQQGVEDAMVQLGFTPEERAFTAHLTIGRVRSNTRMSGLLKKFEERCDVQSAEIEVKEIVLMKSDLKPAGAEYTRIAGISIGGRKNDE